MRRNALMAFDLADRVCIQWPGVENMTRRCTCQIPLHVNGMRPVERWSRTLITPAAAWEFCRRIGSIFQTGTLNRCLTVPVFEVIKHGLQMCWKLKDRSSCDGHVMGSHVVPGLKGCNTSGWCWRSQRVRLSRVNWDSSSRPNDKKHQKAWKKLDHRKPDTRCVRMCSIHFWDFHGSDCCLHFSIAEFCNPLRCFLPQKHHWPVQVETPTDRTTFLEERTGSWWSGKVFCASHWVSIPQPLGSCFRLQNWLSRMDPKWFSSVCQNLG